MQCRVRSHSISAFPELAVSAALFFMQHDATKHKIPQVVLIHNALMHLLFKHCFCRASCWFDKTCFYIFFNLGTDWISYLSEASEENKVDLFTGLSCQNVLERAKKKMFIFHV